MKIYVNGEALEKKFYLEKTDLEPASLEYRPCHRTFNTPALHLVVGKGPSFCFAEEKYMLSFQQMPVEKRY